jgi:signal recognition particle subunit SRP54
MSKLMQDMSGMGLRDRMKAVKQMADQGMMDPNADLRDKKNRSKRGPLDLIAARKKTKNKRKDAKKANKRNRRR